MKGNSVLALYPEKAVNRVIHICNNLFYNQYLEKGILQDANEIKAGIKNEVLNTLVDFFGEEHREKIKSVVNRTKINFIYQTIGLHNSIEQFLKDLRNKRFNAFVGENFKDPSYFVEAASFLAANNNNLKLLIKQDLPIFNQCLKELGFNPNDLLENDFFAGILALEIQEMGQQWSNVTLSDNPEIRANLEFVELFVESVKINTLRESLLRGADEFKLVYQNKLSRVLDPIVVKEQPTDDAFDLLLCGSGDRAFCVEDSLYFDSRPTDSIVLHEFVHRLGNFVDEREDVRTSIGYARYEMFNEFSTELFALLMHQLRIEKKQPVIVNRDITESAYSPLFKAMKRFSGTFLTELKESRMRKFPAEEFIRVIGKDQFEKIACLCNEIVKVGNFKSFCEGLRQIGISVEKTIKEETGFDYGTEGTFLAKTNYVLDQKNQEMEKLVNCVIRQQPCKKRLALYTCHQGYHLADYLESKTNRRLRKLAIGVRGMSNKLETLTQEQIKKKMAKPIESLDEIIK